jgi:hypothetical protein
VVDIGLVRRDAGKRRGIDAARLVVAVVVRKIGGNDD